MKLTDACLKKDFVKKFTNYRDFGYKYKVVRVPALKDAVRVQKEKVESAPCVNEMTRVMDCWKRTDLSMTACSQETEVFLSCIKAAEVASKLAKERTAKGLPSGASHIYPSKQVNETLAKYPTPKYNFVD